VIAPLYGTIAVVGMKVWIDLFDKAIKNHLSYATLREQRPRLRCRRLILTHMSPDMLARQAEAAEECAHDGLTITV
jgi:hypothetical protein